MVDRLSPERRSALMAKVGSKNTRPERRVRKCAHALGYRFRLHRKDLPGSPDIVFPRLRKAVFVHGCFWHRHAGCAKSSMPKTRVEFWTAKFSANVTRDASNTMALEKLGWSVLTIWECETRSAENLAASLAAFLEDQGS
jgi:DNA mismatch endonuclease (patch repair protein)